MTLSSSFLGPSCSNHGWMIGCLRQIRDWLISKKRHCNPVTLTKRVCHAVMLRFDLSAVALIAFDLILNARHFHALDYAAEKAVLFSTPRISPCCLLSSHEHSPSPLLTVYSERNIMQTAWRRVCLKHHFQLCLGSCDVCVTRCMQA